MLANEKWRIGFVRNYTGLPLWLSGLTALLRAKSRIRQTTYYGKSFFL